MVFSKRLSKLKIVLLLCVTPTGYAYSADGLANNAILLITPAIITPETINIKPDQGSFFSMEVDTGSLTYVAIAGFDHLQLGITQIASVDSPEIDKPWSFFGNLGVHQSTLPVAILTDDKAGNVTLDFSGWAISWNAIPMIPLGTGLDNGVATLTCAKTCDFGETYSLVYHASVFDEAPYGKGNVNYVVEFTGKIVADIVVPFDVSDIMISDGNLSTSLVFMPGSTASAVGNTSGINLSIADIGKNDTLLSNTDGEQCVGGCIDFEVTGLTTDYIDVVFKVSEPVPAGAVYRKLINEAWQTFDVENGNRLASAGTDSNGNCQGYLGDFTEGLQEGALCIFMRIYDGGDNDADGVKNGTVVDPSGVLDPGKANSSSNGGCSISQQPISIADRVDWIIVTVFLLVIGTRQFLLRGGRVANSNR